MALRIYNTLTREKEPFEPGKDGRVSIYQCGPTVYAPTHYGHLRPLVVVDVMVRYLESMGHDVTHVENFTDVDDRIIQRAQEEDMDPLDLAGQYIDEYLDVARMLGVKPADRYPRVSEHIPQITELIESLVEGGHAYAVDGDVYFSVETYPEYGQLSGRRLEDMEAGSRIEVDERKRHPADFALWKASKPGEPAWESPWGPGRPGWHIECSAMSIAYLGATIDIHAGGKDLVFPHHENEIAQSESATGQRPFVRYWVHNGLCHLDEEKMSKSLGNIIAARDLLRRYRPEVVRLSLLSAHYRSPQVFADTLLDETQKAWDRLATTWARIDQVLARTPDADEGNAQAAAAAGGGSGESQAAGLAAAAAAGRASFHAAMEDDFNTALAIGSLFELARAVNHGLNRLQEPPTPEERGALEAAAALFDETGRMLGIKDISPEHDHRGGDRVEELVDLIVEVREAVRSLEDWSLADRIRDRLAQLGVRVEDSPHGSRWRWEN